MSGFLEKILKLCIITPGIDAFKPVKILKCMAYYYLF